MARTQTTKQAKSTEPQEESPEIADSVRTLDSASVSQVGGISKADACRAALAKGIETAATAVSFIKSEFGIEIKPADFSLYKSKEKAKRGLSRSYQPKGGPKKRAPLVEGYVAPPPKSKDDSEPDLMLALESVKELVDQFGADKLKRMVDLMG